MRAPLIAILSSLVFCACPGEDPSHPPTTDQPPLLTDGDPIPTATSEEPTTSSTGGPASTATTTTSSSSSTGDPEPSCEGTVERCPKRARTFCGEVALDAEQLPQPYRDIAVGKCADDPCGACFYLANTCTQLFGREACGEDLYDRCLCLAAEHGAL